MESGVWIEREAFEELSVLVCDLAQCERRLMAWLERNGPSTGGAVSHPALAAGQSSRRAAGAGEEQGDGQRDDGQRDDGQSRRSWGRSRSREVVRATGYIERYYDQRIGLTRVARHVGCSRTHLARVFRRETGGTVHAYLQRVRLRRAVSGVREGNKVEAVMLGVGYRSKRNFYRLFKARLGVSPGAFRMKT